MMEIEAILAKITLTALSLAGLLAIALIIAKQTARKKRHLERGKAMEQNRDQRTLATNDYDRIARAIDEALAAFTGNAHEPLRDNNSDSITMTKYGFVTGVIRLQRLRDWVEGLAQTHRATNGQLGQSQSMPRDADLRNDDAGESEHQ